MKGRALKGERAIASLPATRGANVHCVASISPTSLISFSTHMGSLKADDFQQCLTKIGEGLERTGLNKVVLCIDNAPWHVHAETQWEEVVRHFSRGGQIRDWILLRLAPYSYSCSPIERFWSAFKEGSNKNSGAGVKKFLRSAFPVASPRLRGENTSYAKLP